jgi:septum formation protein
MLVLASASPRRQELLRNVGIPFTVHPADIEEKQIPGEPAVDCAERLAREKALAVWRTRPHDLVLGADTIVVVDDAILGKPRDAADAARMLRMLSGRVHRVITGVCLVKPILSSQYPVPSVKVPRGEEDSDKNRGLTSASEMTLVTMSQIDDNEIQVYVASGEPMDKAGAYAIQGMAARWIPRIEGDYSNVVGLPIALVYRMLGGFKLGLNF